MKRIMLYLNTICYLKISQIVWRIFYQFHTSKVASQLTSTNFVILPSNDKTFFIRKKIIFNGEEFTFLNVKAKPNGWNDPNQKKLWLYNLHYFDYLMSKNSHNFPSIMKKWISENPMAIGNGWEPYPTSLRIVNWIKYHLSIKPLDKDELSSLEKQILYLTHKIEYHILANHLFENLKGIVLGSLFFEKDDLYEKYLLIFNNELREQVNQDGSHFEFSPMYHAIILEGILDMIHIHRRLNKKYPLRWEEIAKKMLLYLNYVSHPNGEIPFFNDSSNEIASSTNELRLYAENLGLKLNPLLQSIMHFKNAHICRFQKENHFIVIKNSNVGPSYQPGHTHADNLSFELSLNGKKIIVNTGTSTYDTNERRHYERSSKAHNTISINDLSQSEVWGSFRVARRARPINTSINLNVDNMNYQGSYLGFYPLKAIHHREIVWNKNTIKIQDSVHNAPINSEAKSYLHFHPDVSLEEFNGSIVGSINGHRYFTILIDQKENYKVKIFDTTYSPQFGLEIPNKSLSIRTATTELDLILIYEEIKQ